MPCALNFSCAHRSNSAPASTSCAATSSPVALSTTGNFHPTPSPAALPAPNPKFPTPTSLESRLQPVARPIYQRRPTPAKTTKFPMLKSSLQDGTKTKIFQNPNPQHQPLPTTKIARSSQILLLLILRPPPRPRIPNRSRQVPAANAMATSPLHFRESRWTPTPTKFHSLPASVHRAYPPKPIRTLQSDHPRPLELPKPRPPKLHVHWDHDPLPILLSPQGERAGAGVRGEAVRLVCSLERRFMGEGRAEG